MLGIKYPQIDKQQLQFYTKPVAYTHRPTPFKTAYEIVEFLTEHTAFINSSKLPKNPASKFSKAIDKNLLRQSSVAHSHTHGIMLDLDRKPHNSPTATNKEEVLSALSKFFGVITYQDSWTPSTMFKGRVGLFSTTEFDKAKLQNFLHAFLQDKFNSLVEVVAEEANYPLFKGLTKYPSTIKHEYLDRVAFNQSHIMFTYGNPVEVWVDGKYHSTTNHEELPNPSLHDINIKTSIPKVTTQTRLRYKDHKHPILHLPQEQMQKVIDRVEDAAKREKTTPAVLLINMKRGKYTPLTEVVYQGEPRLLVELVADSYMNHKTINCGFIDHVGSNPRGHIHIHDGIVRDFSHGTVRLLTLLDKPKPSKHTLIPITDKYKPDTYSEAQLLFINSPTGTGKTHQYTSSESDVKLIILTPTLDLRDDIAKSPFITKVETGDAVPPNTSVVMTYHKFAGHYNAKDIDFQAYRIIVDEAPRLFQSQKDKHTTNLNNLLGILLDAKEFHQVVLVSADYQFYNKFIQLPHNEDYEVMEYTVSKPRKVTIVDNMPNLDIDGFVVLYINSRSKAEQIQQQMVGKNFRIVYKDVDSFDPAQIDSDDTLDGIIFTSKMREGYSIHRKVALSVADVTANGMHPSGSAHAIQALNRARDCSNFVIVHSQALNPTLPDLSYEAVTRLLGPLTKADMVKDAPLLKELPVLYHYKQSLKEEENLTGWKLYNNIIVGRIDYLRALNEYNNIETFTDGMVEAGYEVKHDTLPKWLKYAKQDHFVGGSLEEWNRVADTDDRVREQLDRVIDKIEEFACTIDNLDGSLSIPEEVVLDILNSQKKTKLLTMYKASDFETFDKIGLLGNTVGLRTVISKFKALGKMINKADTKWDIAVIDKYLGRVCIGYNWVDSMGNELKTIRAKREKGQRGGVAIIGYESADGKETYKRATKGKIAYPANGYIKLDNPLDFYKELIPC